MCTLSSSRSMYGYVKTSLQPTPSHPERTICSSVGYAQIELQKTRAQYASTVILQTDKYIISSIEAVIESDQCQYQSIDNVHPLLLIGLSNEE